MKIAKFIKDNTGVNHNVVKQSVYKVTPPIKKERKVFHYVVASAANIPFSGTETYLFGATKNGKIIDWGELPGSQRGTLSHHRAFESIGYSIE